MRKTLAAQVLVLVLCSNVFAGDIPSPPAPATICDPGDPACATADVPDSPSAIQSSDEQTADGLVGAALTVLDSVLTLF
jgi:hypothetical protein